MELRGEHQVRTERIMALGTEAAVGLLIFEECGRIGPLNGPPAAQLCDYLSKFTPHL